jgi:hypothetical protein
MADLESKVVKQRIGLADVAEVGGGIALVYHTLKRHGWSRAKIVEEFAAAGGGVAVLELMKKYGATAYIKNHAKAAKEKVDNYMKK